MENDRKAAIDALKQSFREEQAGRALRQRRALPLGKIIAPLVIILGVAVVLVPLGYAGLHVKDSLDAANVVNSFCDRDANHEYGSAYLLLSAHLRSEISQADLARATEQSQLGACTYSERAWWFDLTKNPVVVPVTLSAGSITGGDPGQGTGVFLLIRDGSAWKIDGIQTDVFTLP